MKVRGLELPNTLQTVLLNGVWTSRGDDYSGIWHDDYHIALFKKLFPRVEGCPWPHFFGYEEMLEVNNGFWNGERNIIKLYLGKSSKDYPPGNIDPHLTIFIGESDPDSPIALDYRTPTPRVVYFCDVKYKILWIEAVKTLWVEAAKDIETLLSALELNSK
ncbi:MAG: hypothetical protein DRR00_16290 [Candidatus Parabeggiatoa sp. nov. 3]|nr:MAG: hypothetical protein DRR00_16290 [Gammaproteobacteria bacterium]